MDEDRATSNDGVPRGMGTFLISGVVVRFHFTFLLLLVFLLIAGLGTNESPAFYGVYVVSLFASVLLHDLGHALAGRSVGIRTREIVVFPTGGIAKLDRTPTAGQELWIALAGPMMNLAIAGLLFAILAKRHALVGIEALADPTDANLVERIAAGNLILALVNLLPSFPMDGGRVMRSALAIAYPNSDATRLSSWAGRLIAVLIGIYGLATFQLVLVTVAVFVYLGAAQDGAAALGRRLTRGIPVRAAMVTDYKTLSHGNTVRDAANLLVATAQHDFPVVHGEQVIGLLGRSAVLRAMALDGPETYVAGVMERNFPTLSPDMDLEEVLPMMASAGACALVMQGERLLGLLTSENLSQFVLLRRFGMEPTA